MEKRSEPIRFGFRTHYGEVYILMVKGSSKDGRHERQHLCRLAILLSQ
jgi:hypothetical protein